MKPRTTWICMSVLLVAAASAAQESGQTVSEQSQIEQGREMIRQGRLDMVRSELVLTKKQAADFWPIYSAYRAETDAIQDRYAAMVAEYLRRYSDANLTEEYGDELIATFFGIKQELLDVQSKFLPEFRNVLPALKVARLFQLENKINAEIDAQMAPMIPLVDPG
jgi:hypothetical protein